jgi:catechol 2,3-dioxygenase-like lactoylglutathione lyase family enzyme
MVGHGYDRTHLISLPAALPAAARRRGVGDRRYGRPVIDHLGLQCTDADAAAAFYLRVLAPCGVSEAMRIDTPAGPVVGLSGPAASHQLWLGPAEDRGHRPVHLALAAPSREAVDEVFGLARESGAEILHEPRVWPEYHPGYYAVFFRDPDGNNVEAVHHGAPPS